MRINSQLEIREGELTELCQRYSVCALSVFGSALGDTERAARLPDLEIDVNTILRLDCAPHSGASPRIAFPRTFRARAVGLSSERGVTTCACVELSASPVGGRS